MLAVTVHTTGINWASVIITAAAAVTILTVVLGILTKPWRDKLDDVISEQQSIKADAKTAAAAAAITSSAVARVEGYLAAQNGGGTRLPPVRG